MPVLSYLAQNKISGEVVKRLEFSRYLVDPCRFKFNMLVRILANVLAFIRKLREKVLAKKVSKTMVDEDGSSHVAFFGVRNQKSLEEHFAGAYENAQTVTSEDEGVCTLKH